MIRKLVKIAVFCCITPIVLVTCILYFSYLTFHLSNYKYSKDAYTSNVSFAALPGTENIIEDITEQKDARVETVRRFFVRYKSDLEPFAGDVITAADKYGLDYKLIPAIAMQESNLCKKAPKNSYNCWGFGIYGKKVTKFEDYKEAIDTVTKTLAMEYKGKGLETAEEIMAKYTPSNTGAWADSVNFFMKQLEI